MLADVDRAVAALLESERLGGQAAKVAFDAPKKEWAAARTAPTLNLFLADIREDLTRRTTTLIEEVGENGIVESRRQPFRFYNLTYALTAWASRPEDDHQLLGLALRAHNDHPKVIIMVDAGDDIIMMQHVLVQEIAYRKFRRPVANRHRGDNLLPVQEQGQWLFRQPVLWHFLPQPARTHLRPIQEW